MENSLSEIFKVLADDNRLKIVRIIAKGKKCAGELLDEIGISQPTLSHHMSILTKNKLVKATKVGTQVYYELNRESIRCLCGFVREISCTGSFMCGGENNKREV